MMRKITVSTLNTPLAHNVLDYLHITPAKPDVAFLNTLLSTYIRRVPWESVSRIAKRARTAATNDCPRFEEEFWQSAIENGTGGTCFESNYAFFSLLQFLGYDGYLTINDMMTPACHTAIVVNLEGEQWLADAGFPVHRAVRLHPTKVTQQKEKFYNYTAKQVMPSLFQIKRTPHPNPFCFTLKNFPISEVDYRAATTNDYGENGLVLDKVIISRIVDEQIWRFTRMDGKFILESFDDKGVRTEYALDNVVETVSQRFAMNPSLVEAAIKAVS
jgi:arylamine N-acetyltransferase